MTMGNRLVENVNDQTETLSNIKGHRSSFIYLINICRSARITSLLHDTGIRPAEFYPGKSTYSNHSNQFAESNEARVRLENISVPSLLRAEELRENRSKYNVML
jgi:hypothetical protein